MSSNTSDQELIRQIRGTTAMRDKALQSFFRDKALQSTVVGYAKANGGTEDDGKDLFQDAMIIFDRNIRADKYKGQSSLRTYFVAIAKWQWANTRRKKYNYHEELSNNAVEIESEGPSDNPEVNVIRDERKTLLHQAVNQVGGRCVALLHLYKLSYSMDEIARELALSSPEMAKKEVYRCRERLRNHLFSQPDILHLLREYEG
jgi:RNA polymerase sigma factor (sigma-70 family)